MRLLMFNLALDQDDPALGFCATWVTALAAHFEAIDLITVRCGRYEVPSNVAVYSLGKERGFSRWRRLFEFYAILFRLLSRNRYTVCFAHMQPVFTLLAGPALKFSRVPILLWYSHRAVSLRLRIAVWFSARVLSPLPTTLRIATAKRLAIGHGIDTALFCAGPDTLRADRSVRFVVVGRLTPIKQLALIMRAFARAVQGHPDLNLRLKFVGTALNFEDTEYARSLWELRKKLDLSSQVSFSDALPYERVREAYWEAHCLINLTATTSIDKVLLEAMACECCVIAAPECRAVFDTELAPICVADGSQEDLSARIVQIARMSREQRRKLGKEFREIVKSDHSVEKLAYTIATLSAKLSAR